MSARDVLMENLPDYFKPVKEYNQIMKAQGYELDKLDGVVIRVKGNNYIQTADGNTLSYYERLLGITPDASDPLSFRRKRILSIIARDSPFSIGFLHQQLMQLYGADGYMLEIDYQNCRLKITITTDIYGATDLFYDFIWDVIPAHIEMQVKQNLVSQVEGLTMAGGAMEVIETVSM